MPAPNNGVRTIPKKTNQYNYKDRRHYLFLHARSRAKLRGIEFSILEHEIEWNTHCPILGIELQYDRRGAVSRNNAPSFDRVDPEKGYVKGNVCVISNKANSLKQDSTLQQLEALVSYVKQRVL